ncbi:phosphatase PAP2 family protein [Sphingomonas sabuli]|uniref:Phosphatase PAP2 family protein n=1 Tax=Sphingomonas sabuli TaxID=2764186 RepID=A0A7G9L2L9_9SPHN|nr:phosphatase PAP2 family protein [Sphingomonas sabuli]QNM82868.1 phosphatase PAP2 family protein [Sphingomonas sabuli]
MLSLGAGAADGRILAMFYAGDNPTAVAIAQFITVFGNAPVSVLFATLGAAILLVMKHPRRGFALLAVVFGGRLLVSAQKYSILRLRPEIEAHLVPVSNPSFPSGHAANSMILWVALALILFGDTRFRNVALAIGLSIAVLVGLSRLVLGVHWPSDVVGGWAFGALWVLIALPVAERLFVPKR